jgi:hypothetical protein
VFINLQNIFHSQSFGNEKCSFVQKGRHLGRNSK